MNNGRSGQRVEWITEGVDNGRSEQQQEWTKGGVDNGRNGKREYSGQRDEWSQE